MPSYGTIPELPHVAKLFCPSECVRLIQDQASMRNVDSRIHSPRFDCCVFLFYSFSAVTFATQSATNGPALKIPTLRVKIRPVLAGYKACEASRPLVPSPLTRAPRPSIDPSSTVLVWGCRATLCLRC